MGIRRTLSLLAMVFLLVMTLASAALAGEVKGPPGPGGAEGGATPVEGFWMGTGAASICSFSGWNDIIEESEPTRTQSYGTFVVLIKKTYNVSTAEAKAMLGEAPGTACNPTKFGNPKK